MMLALPFTTTIYWYYYRSVKTRTVVGRPQFVRSLRFIHESVFYTKSPVHIPYIYTDQKPTILDYVNQHKRCLFDFLPLPD